MSARSLYVAIVLSSALLALCAIFALVSFLAGFHVVWHRDSVGASNGVALWGHYARDYRGRANHRWGGVSLIYNRNVATGGIPGFGFAGFHYYRSSGLRLIGVPLWVPVVALGRHALGIDPLVAEATASAGALPRVRL